MHEPLIKEYDCASNCYVPECMEGDVFVEDLLEEMAPRLGFAE